MAEPIVDEDRDLEPATVDEPEAVAVDPEPVAVEPDAAGPVGSRRARGLVWQARVGLLVGIVGIALAAVAFSQAADLRAEADRRVAVLEAAELVALRVTTFEGASIEDWVADLQTLATGTYADEVAALFDAEIRQGLAENRVDSVGTIESSFVQDVGETTATAFLVVRQEFVTLVQPQPVSDELRMEVRLDLVDGAWLASDVAILGPSRVAPVAGGDAAPAIPDLSPSEGAPGS